MFKNIVIAAVISLIVSGCVYPTYTTKLDSPISKSSVEPEVSEGFKSIMSVDKSIQTASIGDDLFVVQRFIAVTETYERIPYLAPTGKGFPVGAAWAATYSYNDGTSGDLLVYTSPAYYQGQIGVILDAEYVISTAARRSFNKEERFDVAKDSESKVRCVRGLKATECWRGNSETTLIEREVKVSSGSAGRRI